LEESQLYEMRGVIRTATLVITAVVAVSVSASNRKAISLPEDGIPVNSKFGRNVMDSARKLDGGNDDDQGGAVDFSFVSGYAIKFQGCHHISQWNDNYAGDGDGGDYDVRILTKRLIRFRLCPIGSCSDVKSAGCTSKYGDYVVDMNTFVYYYLQAQADAEEYNCEQIYNSCSNSCDNEDDDCMLTCYANAGLASCSKNDDDGYANNFEAINYAQCAAYGDGGDDDSSYYIGPYCADQGGGIYLSLFTDDSCTATASNSKSTFYSLSGYELPYSSSSLIPTTCMTCLEPSENYYDDGYQPEANVKDICSNIYSASGKCESKMSVDYPNESACTYIEGIKIIREDGVIRTSTKRKSKAAAVSIGIFTTIGVLLAGYVYYLRTKLGRAKINLSPPGATLT